MKRVVASIAALASFAMVGCSSSSSGTTQGGASREVPISHRSAPAKTVPSGDTGPGCTPDVVPRVCTTVHITGQTSADGRAVTVSPAPPSATPSTTCAELADGSDGEAPLGAQVTVGGQHVQWDLTLDPYHGPGTYPATDVTLTAGRHSYFAESASQVKVTVGVDFATQIAFTGLLDGGSGPGQVSGSISWNCVNADG